MMAVFSVICGALCAVIALWKIPPYQVRTALARYRVSDITGSDLLKAENDRRSTLAQIIGGVVILVGLYFTKETLNLEQNGQITDRINKAVEQLGTKEKPAVVLGGIYQLGSIARDSRRDHWAMLSVLNSFVEEHASYGFMENEATYQQCSDVEHGDYDPSFVPDRLTQAVMNVLRYEPIESSSDPRSIVSILHADLHFVDLSGATLGNAQLGGDNFTGAMLNHVTLLPGANLNYSRLSHVHLSQSSLRGVSLQHTCLTHADLSDSDLRGADLTGAVGLTSDVLGNARLDCETKLPVDLAYLRGKCHDTVSNPR